ncbi:MAG: tetratricopeptide repeat protein, partial [Bacteroidota bacterium]
MLVVLAALGVGMAGCQPGSALHSRYNNFRAYYNTYYNATQKLDEGERSLERGDAPVDRNVLVSVFPATPASGGSGGPFQEAIDKSAELLRNRPTSKWADDALLVIGKAYFYQRNFVGAEQKFRETLAAAALSDDRRLGDEARFWLGRTFASADRYDDGVATLEEGLIAEGGDRRWTSRMRLALGELYARAGRWDEAAEALREGAPEVGDADLAARAYVLLGQVEEQAERFEDAAQAYDQALRSRPVYELAFAAEVSRALVLGLDAGRPEAGLDIVERMQRDDKHYARRGELALVRARLLAADARPREAEEQYLDVLYDEELAAGSVRPQAHFRLGEFVRDVRQDYVRASAHFDTAATGYREPPATERPSRGAIRDLADVAQTYSTLAEAARGVSEADSLLALGALSDDEFEAWRVRVEAERLEAFLEEQRQIEAQREQQRFAGGGGLGESLSGTEQAADQAASGGQVQGAGFLNYRNPSALQAGAVAFQQRWGDRPRVPQWRRAADVRLSAANQDGEDDGETINLLLIGEGPPPLDLTPIPRTEAAREAMITDLAGLRYELANAFFLSLARADTAAALYRAILSDTPDLPVATRARYALGEIELEAGRAEAARPFYEAVIADDPASTLAQAAQARLSRTAVVEQDTSAAQTAAYDAARRRWQAGAPREAAADLIAVADAAPDADLAPRAYLAAAVAYAEWILPDTLALAGPMPGDLVSPVLLEAARDLEPLEPEADETPASEPEPAPAAPVAAPGELRSLERPATSPEDQQRVLEEELRPMQRARGAESGRPAPVQPVPVEPLPAESESDDASLLREPIPTEPLPVEPEDAALNRPVPVEPEPVRPEPVQPAPDADPGDAELAEVEPGEVEPAVSSDRRLLDLEAAETPLQVPAPDSTLAPAPDSSEVVAPADVAPAVAPPASDTTSFTLHDHLRALAALYPDAEVAQRAQAMVDALPPRWLPADTLVADTSAIEPFASDFLTPPPLDSTAAPAASETDVPADAPEADPVAEADPPIDTDAAGLRGEAPIDPEAGGYTWRVRTLSIASEGDVTVRVLTEAGFRAAVAQDRETRAFAILLGQFETEAAAEAAGPLLPAWTQARG